MRSINRFGQIALFVGGVFASWYAPTLLLVPEPQPWGYVLLIVALVAFSILGVQINHIEHIQSSIRIRTELLPIIIGVALAGIAILLTPVEPAKPWPILILWVGGMAGILAGARLLDKTDAIVSEPRIARWEIYTIVGLTIIALLARGVLVDSIPITIHGDEGEMGMVARSVLRGELNDPFVTAFLDHPTLWFFLQAFALRLFGDTIGGLRLFSALIGAATIPLCYLFARDQYGRRIALIATILLTTYHFHIHFSRIALNNIVDPLMALIAFSAFLRGWRNRSWVAFAVAGLAAGLAQHFYMGGRIIVVIIGALLIHQALFDRAKLQARWQGLLLMGLATLAAFGPLLRYFLEHPKAYMARIDVAGLFQTGRAADLMAQGWSLQGVLIDQANRSFGAYLYKIDTGLFYAPNIPLLDPIQGALFLCGIGIALAGIKRLNRFLLLVWIGGVALFGGMLLIDPPQSPRYLIAAPAICILIAGGLNQAAILLRKLALPARIVQAALGVVTIVFAVSGISWYFWTYTPALRYGGTRNLTTIAYHIRKLPADRYVFFLGAPYAYIKHGTISFLTNRHPGVDVLTPISTPEQVPTPPPGMHPVFVLLSARSAELAMVQARYPGGQLSVYEDPLGVVTPLVIVSEAP
ncbi:MAG: glycosyltransferase family 39 protein, partial [Roseiflexaceae bacterium]|nr:glycosyltransferase family 39 protein [Roseiflexaceae bacterium]